MALEDQIDFEDFFMGKSMGRADREEVQANRGRLKPKSLLSDVLNRSFDESAFKASVKRRMQEHEERLTRLNPAAPDGARSLAHWMATVDAKLAWFEAFYPEPDVFRAHGGPRATVTPEEVAEIKAALKSLAGILSTHLEEEGRRLALAPVPEIAPNAKLLSKIDAKFGQSDARFDQMFSAVDAQFKESAARLQRLDDAVLVLTRKQAMSGPAPAAAPNKLLRLYALLLTHVLVVALLSGGLILVLRYFKV